ncbi:hypothetical protein D9619_006967 [Psilocybe cf. subviscida]|uniref:ABM domain-containing protein n=1 Tax=Psilocybe cf. subviscida TaxID=2480587 RepID=A0A8H5EW82_9AGAR|nr:hypothetical protein D9619_006967 [Psilocybe cf. subviscida]
MPIHEFIQFKPTEAVLADPTAALAPASKFFSTAEGCSGLYFGASEEDKEGVAFIVIVWETYEHHKAVIDSPGYPGIVGLAGTIAGNSTMLHVPFRDAPEPALSAPATEVAVITLKPGKTVADVDAVFESFMHKVESEEEDAAVGTWGQTKEEAEKLVCFFGWASSKRHFEIIGQDKYKDLVASLVGTVDIKFWHASFSRFA